MDNQGARLVRLEERIKTMQAEYRADMSALARDIADRNAAMTRDIANLNAEAAQRQADAADRAARWGWWQFGLTAGLIALGFAVLGFLIRLP